MGSLLSYTSLMLSVFLLRAAIFKLCWDRQESQAILFFDTSVDGQKRDIF